MATPPKSNTLPNNTLPSTLNSRYDIYPGQPLPELDSPSARAYKVEDRMQPQLQLFGLICLPGIPVRWNAMEKISGKLIQGNLALSAFGNIDWPISGQKCLVLIYKRPLGGRVEDFFNANDVPEQKKITIANHILKTGMTALLSLQERNLTNRGIRPNNLFFADKEQEEIVFGEFATASPGFDQPIEFETIERGMANQGGRGDGSLSDDLYSLAATLAILIQRQNPVRGKSNEQIILSKINHGSFQSLVGKSLITNQFLEPLKGILKDNIGERWNLDDLTNWTHGQRVKPRKKKVEKKSKRPFKFGGYDHTSIKSLAYSMSERRESALKLLKDGSIEKWLRVGLKNEELADQISSVVTDASDSMDTMPHSDDFLLSHILILLNPDAPISYKDIAYMPDGFGSAIAIETLRKGDIKNHADSIIKGLPHLWYKNSNLDPNSYLTELDFFDRIERYLKKGGPGYGIERCLYETNTGYACQSPIIARENIFIIEMLLPTLNLVEKSVDTKKSPIDRHIAAFIAARSLGNIDSYLAQLGDLDGSIQTLGMLRLLVHLQDKMSSGTLMGLTKWVGGLMGPVIRLYHNRQKRKEIESDVPKMVRSGDLSELLALVDDPAAKHEDERNYLEAVDQYHEAEDEITDIEENTGPGTDTADNTSKQSAAIVSILIMVFIVSMIIMTG